MGEILGTLSFATASRARIVQRNENGSIVVEFPICSAGTIDLSRTAGKGSGALTLTDADLREMASNIAEWPGPIPINVAPHRPFEATHGAAPGFIDSADVRDGQLWARCTLTGDLAREFEAGMWRGFSVDIARNPTLPSKSLSGWAVWGGVLTNRPAAPVNFEVDAAVAASAAELCVVSLSVSPGDEPQGKKGNPMGDQDKAPEVVALEAELKVKNEAFASLTTRIRGLEEELDTTKALLNQRQSALASVEKKAQAAKDEAASLSRRLEERENEALALSIRKVVHQAIDRGVEPAAFDGVDNDPVAWFRKSFVSLEALELMCKSLPVTKNTAVSSGREKHADLDNATLSQERLANLRSLGLDPKYASVTSSDDLRQMKR